MLMSRRVIPTIGEPPTPWSFDRALQLCHLACRLRIKVWLDLACLPSWTHLVLISLCCALGLGLDINPLLQALICLLRDTSNVL